LDCEPPKAAGCGHQRGVHDAVAEISALRFRLQTIRRTREFALFNLAIDSKLRGCDLVGLRVSDVVQDSHVAARAFIQKKTQ
jgi:hypothetical protein